MSHTHQPVYMSTSARTHAHTQTYMHTRLRISGGFIVAQKTKIYDKFFVYTGAHISPAGRVTPV
jgi:mitochondrial fission protein ELM1